TPIAIIKGFAGLLSDPEMKWTPEQARDKAGIILEESRRLEEMVEQMLYATRIQAGKILLQNETVALDRLLKRTLQKLEPMAEQAGVTLSLFLPNEVPPVTGDPERLQQVVINLVENAFKYAPKGQVEVAVHVQEREVLVEVTDSGPGVKEEDKERIFTPFERGAEHLNTRIRGTGLGLYICKAIVEAHGGRIGVESLPNGGRFFFTIPREEYRR
ncbi:sensor histidine kinase, partial [bacterium CPR1]|nr:sensor histidine kinase [bacterium CPR1]